jgi:peptidoglycan-associated lipoprotein
MLRNLSNLLVAPFTVVLLACGGAPPVAKTSHPAVTNPQPRDTGMSVETPQQAASSGSVRVSEEIRKACGIADGDAYFAFDSAILRGQDLPVLDKVATCFMSGPLAGRTLRLVGHCDPRGTIDYNLILGQARADAVANYVRRLGLTMNRLQPISRGALDARGTDEASWQKDRRVDVLLAP